MKFDFLWFGLPPLTEAQKKDVIILHCQKLIAQCDFTQLIDNLLTLSKQLEWQGYRDDLREIIASLKDDTLPVDNISLPIMPLEE